MIEAALSENTRVRIDISSVNGVGNVFYRRREAGIEWTPDAKLQRGRTYVFVMDWRDHPGKDRAWYTEREAKFRDEGLLHIFRQEVDRDYAAAISNAIIPREWVRSAIDAHLKFPKLEDGKWVAGLDVADGGGDRNALVKRKGNVPIGARRARERRFKPTLVGPPIELDDYRRAMDELLPTVSTSVAAHRARVEEMFLKRSADRFVPVPG